MYCPNGCSHKLFKCCFINWCLFEIAWFVGISCFVLTVYHFMLAFDRPLLKLLSAIMHGLEGLAPIGRLTPPPP